MPQVGSVKVTRTIRTRVLFDTQTMFYDGRAMSTQSNVYKLRGSGREPFLL